MSAETPCGIRHVELSGSLPDLVPEAGEQTLMVVFWWHGVPLGRRIFSAGELPVPGSALAAIAASTCAPALAAHGMVPGEDGAKRLRAETDVAARQVAGPVSVIICTRDRPDELARCLDSIARSVPAPDEIIVVDNAPEGCATRDVLSDRPDLRYVAEPRPGLSQARNAGIAAACGQILVFTDDDVEVAQNWLTPLIAGFADPQVGCVTGLVLPAALDSPAAFAFEVDWGGLAGSFLPASFDHTLLDQQFGEAPPVWQVGAGANMALRRVLVDQIGPFDLRLGAGAAGCSEDSEFWHRALAAGWICRYQPLAVVFHHHRATVGALKRQMRAYMRGHVAALFVQFNQTRHPGNLLRVFVGLPYHFFKTGLHLLLSPTTVRRRVFLSELRGLIEGPVDWARRRRGPKFDTDPI